MVRKITAQMLRDKHACSDQVAIFEKLWPNGAAMTCSNALAAVDARLDLDWVAKNFMPETATKALCSRLENPWCNLQQAIAPAEAVYNKSIERAFGKYDRAVEQADRALKAAKKRAGRKCGRATKSAYADYHTISVPMFVRALNKDAIL